MSVSDLRFWPPPSSGQTMRGRQVGRGGADERINVVEDVGTVASAGGSNSFDTVKSPISRRRSSRPDIEHEFDLRRTTALLS
jgi:hypothetical protein